MAQDLGIEELKRLRTDLRSATEGEARELRRKIAFAESIIRVRDGLDPDKSAPVAGRVRQDELNDIWEALDLGDVVSGWGRMIGGGEDEHVLVEINADHTWNRKVGVGPWVKTPKVAGGRL